MEDETMKKAHCHHRKRENPNERAKKIKKNKIANRPVNREA
jgi:hypothetical protein